MDRKAYTLEELAHFLDGDLNGDGRYTVHGVASLSSATESDITFLSSLKYLSQIGETNAGAILLKKGEQITCLPHSIYVEDPYFCFAKLTALFDPRPSRPTGIHPSAVVAESANIAITASLGPNCFIGENVTVGEYAEIYPNVTVCENSSIGDNCLIYSNVSIYSNVRIGRQVIVHANSVLGSDGFGFAPSRDGWQKIHQLGGVVIGDNVEIGASCAIDRGALEDTIIEQGVIIDNQVHIAHNVVIGEGSAIAGCVGIAGSAKLGKRCIVAGAVAINGHIEIADGTQFHGGTIVTKGVAESGVYASSPPMQEVKKWRKTSVRYRQLDELNRRVDQLEKTLNKSE